MKEKLRRFERALIRLLRATYRQRLQALVAVLPSDEADRLLEEEK